MTALMQSNSLEPDLELRLLAGEINDLDKQGKSVQATMGHKLLRVRELLREQNGEYKNAPLDASGHHSPNGWGRWCKENLKIGMNQASICIHYALDPEGTRKKQCAETKKHSTTPLGATRHARKAWPIWTQEQRDQFAAVVLNLLDTP